MQLIDKQLALSWEAWHGTHQESKPNTQGTYWESSLPMYPWPPARRKHYLLALHLFLETTSKWKCSAVLGSVPANLGNHMCSWWITAEEGALGFHSQTKQSLQLVLHWLAIPTLSDAEPRSKIWKRLLLQDQWLLEFSKEVLGHFLLLSVFQLLVKTKYDYIYPWQSGSPNKRDSSPIAGE